MLSYIAKLSIFLTVFFLTIMFVTYLFLMCYTLFENFYIFT